jgi:hypothetical protein
MQSLEVIAGEAQDVYPSGKLLSVRQRNRKSWACDYFRNFNMRKNEMAEKKMPHSSHEEHLCYLQNIGFVETNMKEYKELVRNPKYVCGNCGRAAADAGNLCKPEKL